jgi:HSP20 family protein
MAIIRFDPFRDPFRDLDRLASQLVSGTRTPAPMPMDAWRSADGYHIALDLPGVDPASTELTVERNSLTVQATRQAVFGDDDQVLTAERPQGSFSRQLILGDDVDAENVRADYTNGVLNLTIPVKQSAQPRRIEIGHDEQGGPQRPQVIDVTDKAPNDPAQTTPQPAETVSAN